MAIKQELSVLLNKKMDRRDFLKHVGVAVVAVSGVSALTRAFIASPSQQTKSSSLASQSHAYGGSAYGGAKAS